MSVDNVSVIPAVSANAAAPGMANGQRDLSAAPSGIPELSIICVNWNSLPYLMECMASIYEHPPEGPYEIIVVDNASPEGGVESLAARFPLVRIVKSNKNLGFAGANNLGFRQSSGRYVLLLNPDTRVIGPAITVMLEHLRSLPDAGIVGCTLLNSDLSIATSSIQKFPTILNQLLTAEWLRLRLPALPLWNIAPLFSESRQPLRVDVIPGACMMLRRDVFERVGLLTEDYFMYAEDIDLNFKVGKLGLSSYYIGQARIVHHGGQSSAMQQMSHWSTIMTYRAMWRFFRKRRGYLYAAAYRVTMGCAAVARLILLAAMLPFADSVGIRASAGKWHSVLKWAVGVEQLQPGR